MVSCTQEFLSILALSFGCLVMLVLLGLSIALAVITLRK